MDDWNGRKGVWSFLAFLADGDLSVVSWLDGMDRWMDGRKEGRKEGMDCLGLIALLGGGRKEAVNERTM